MKAMNTGKIQQEVSDDEVYAWMKKLDAEVSNAGISVSEKLIQSTLEAAKTVPEETEVSEMKPIPRILMKRFGHFTKDIRGQLGIVIAAMLCVVIFGIVTQTMDKTKDSAAPEGTDNSAAMMSLDRSPENLMPTMAAGTGEAERKSEVYTEPTPAPSLKNSNATKGDTQANDIITESTLQMANALLGESVMLNAQEASVYGLNVQTVLYAFRMEKYLISVEPVEEKLLSYSVSVYEISENNLAETLLERFSMSSKLTDVRLMGNEICYSAEDGTTGTLYELED